MPNLGMSRFISLIKLSSAAAFARTSHYSNLNFTYEEDYKNRLLHRKCDVRIFIHELRDFGKRTSERSERVSFPKSCNE